MRREFSVFSVEVSKVTIASLWSAVFVLTDERYQTEGYSFFY